jgi:cyclophilin family peptidyl-prolyl cis-trans isomerase
VCFLAGFASSATGGNPSEGAAADSGKPDSLPDSVLSGAVVSPESIPEVDVVVDVPRFGSFRIRLYREQVPNHVAAFLSLAARGYYNGMRFHRVVPGLLVQTGDPRSRDDDLGNDGRLAAPFRIPAASSAPNHRRGSVAFAWRGGDSGSASTHWYVSLVEDPRLDSHGTVFGEVTEGMDVVEGISQVTTLRNRNPLTPVTIEAVRLTEAKRSP